MSERTCTDCRAACCKGPVNIELTADEYDAMAAAGTRLHVVAAPEPRYREKVPYPALVTDDEGPVEVRYMKGHETQPLAAGLGRYVLLGTCGFLKTSRKGWEFCGAYEQRPGACRDFEEGGDRCIIIRQLQGVDPVTPELREAQDRFLDSF